jgi:hypothetical protein
MALGFLLGLTSYVCSGFFNRAQNYSPVGSAMRPPPPKRGSKGEVAGAIAALSECTSTGAAKATDANNATAKEVEKRIFMR